MVLSRSRYMDDKIVRRVDFENVIGTDEHRRCPFLDD